MRVARRVVVLTGAGVSAESGIRTFRDTMEGLWKEFDPQTLATPEAFEANPELVTRWYDHRRVGCLAAEPNAAHIAIARWERALAARGGELTVLTQNVDRLHQRAGSLRVVELHGSIIEWRCTATGRKVVPAPGPFDTFPPLSPFAGDGGALLRPDVVWFGEALPEAALRAAGAATDACDAFFSVGTSAVVYPAAAFARIAAAKGAFVCEVNRDPTPLSDDADTALHGLAGEILPRLVDEAFGGA